MKITSISNSQNYNRQQNFRMKIAQEPLENISKELLSSSSLLHRIPNLVEKLRNIASDAVTLSYYHHSRVWERLLGYTPEDFFSFTYMIDGYESFGSYIFTKTRKSFNVHDMPLSLINYTMDKLAEDGKLRQNLEKLKSDFPFHERHINYKWADLLEADSARAEVIKIREAEAAKLAAEKAEYCKQHPILSRIQAFFGK